MKLDYYECTIGITDFGVLPIGEGEGIFPVNFFPPRAEGLRLRNSGSFVIPLSLRGKEAIKIPFAGLHFPLS